MQSEKMQKILGEKVFGNPYKKKLGILGKTKNNFFGKNDEKFRKCKYGV
jgi:hypothetical protein